MTRFNFSCVNTRSSIFFYFQDFQEGIGAPIFLLTSQVGGLGLTLTKADRVIVVDPAWNPRCLSFFRHSDSVKFDEHDNYIIGLMIGRFVNDCQMYFSKDSHNA